MNYEVFLYASVAIYIMQLLVSLKIFARTDELKELKAEILEKCIIKDVYNENHRALQDQMLQIHQDISDVKNLLITVVNNNYRNN